MADSHAGGGGSGVAGKIAGFALACLLVLLVANGILNRIDNRPLFSGIFPDRQYVDPNPGFQPLSQASAQQQAPPQSNCTPVTDAREVPNTMCKRAASDVQLSWRGRSDYCVPKQPPGTRLCLNRETGHLAWQ